MLSIPYAATIAVAGLLVGCATSGMRTPTTSETTRGASASNLVTTQELARITPGFSLMDALEQLRPIMLRSRGTTPRVSVDGSPPAELSLLRMIPASVVREVRLQRSSSGVSHAAIGANGDIIVGDLIVVSTWQGGQRKP